MSILCRLFGHRAIWAIGPDGKGRFECDRCAMVRAVLPDQQLRTRAPEVESAAVRVRQRLAREAAEPKNVKRFARG